MIIALLTIVFSCLSAPLNRNVVETSDRHSWLEYSYQSSQEYETETNSYLLFFVMPLHRSIQFSFGLSEVVEFSQNYVFRASYSTDLLGGYAYSKASYYLSETEGFEDAFEFVVGYFYQAGRLRGYLEPYLYRDVYNVEEYTGWELSIGANISRDFHLALANMSTFESHSAYDQHYLGPALEWNPSDLLNARITVGTSLVEEDSWIIRLNLFGNG